MEPSTPHSGPRRRRFEALRRLAFVLVAGALWSCASAPGSFTIRFGWAGGKPPPNLPSPLYLYSYIVAAQSATPDVRVATSGPDRYSPGAALHYTNVTDGDGLVLTIELLDSPGDAAQVVAYGESAPFSLGPGKDVEVNVTLQVHGVTTVPSTGGIQVNGLSNGEISTETVSLELFADSSAAGAQISNLPALPAGAGTLVLKSLTPDPSVMPPTGFQAFRYDGWNLDDGLVQPCASGTLCQRSVYVFFTDANGIQSTTSSTTVTLNRQLPGLTTHVTPNPAGASPPYAAGAGVTIAITATPSEPLSQAPKAHVFQIADATAELPGFLSLIPGTEYTFEHAVTAGSTADGGTAGRDINGSYFVTFDLVDVAGNTSSVGGDQSIQFVIDATAPVIENLVVSGGQGPEGALFSQKAAYNAVKADFTTTKALATYAVTINQHPMSCSAGGGAPDGGAGTGATRCTYTETGQDPEGSYPISIVAFDDAENRAVVPNASVTFDYTPPSLVPSSTRVSLANVGVGQIETLTLTPSEPLQLVAGAPALELSVAGPGGGPPVTFAPTAGPDYTFEATIVANDLTGMYATSATMTDLVGNTTLGPEAGPAFQVDTIVPVITNVSTDAQTYSRNASHNLVTLTFDVPKPVDSLNAPGSHLVVSLGGAALPPCTYSSTPSHYTCTYGVTMSDVSGPQTIQITATDEANNSASGSTTVVFDFSAPALTATTAPAVANASSSPFLTVSSNKALATASVVSVTLASGSGVVTSGMLGGGGTSWSASLAGPGADGQFTIVVSGTDAVGNTASTSASFTIDAVTPDITNLKPSGTTFSEIGPYNAVAITFDTPKAATITATIGGAPMTCGAYQPSSPA